MSIFLNVFGQNVRSEEVKMQSAPIGKLFQDFSSFYLSIFSVFESVLMFTSYKLLYQLTNLQPFYAFFICIHAFRYLHHTHLACTCNLFQIAYAWLKIWNIVIAFLPESEWNCHSLKKWNIYHKYMWMFAKWSNGKNFLIFLTWMISPFNSK